MDNFYEQITESINSMFQLTSRIEERLKVVVENQEDLKRQIEKLQDKDENLGKRLVILENKNGTKENVKQLEQDFKEMRQQIGTLDLIAKMNNSRWATILDFIFKVGTIVIGAVILYYLGVGR